jgi:LacI family transcriptional regulator
VTVARQSKVTIRDVARLAGVSTKTVSRVTTGEGQVAAETVRRVQAAIDELGYRANPLARSLRTGHDDAIAVIVTSIADPFFASLVDAVEEAARESGWFLLVGTTGRSAAEELAVINGVLNRSVRGLIVVPAELDYRKSGLPLGPGGIPLVFADRAPVGMPVDVVTIDNAANARLAAEHLIKYGHRRVAFAATDVDPERGDFYPVNERLSGYRSALATHGIEYDPALVVAHSRAGGENQELMLGLLELSDPPTAVLCGNELASLVAIGQLRRAGRKDIAVVSFDDFPMADTLDPPITVLVQDPVLMGRRAFELLHERIHGKKTEPRTVIVPTTFVERGSGEISPNPDSLAAERHQLLTTTKDHI